MPQSQSLSVVPPRRSRAMQRRLTFAICFVIITLVAAIGLVGAMTVHTLADRSSADAVVATAAPAHPGPGIPQLTTHTLRLVAV